MKFTVLQENLLKGLGAVSKAVPVKPPLPILSNILVSFDDGRLKLSATDLNITISTYVGASVSEKHTICIPAKIFHEFISNLAPETLEFSFEEPHLVVKSSKNKAKINTVVAKDFPQLPILSDEFPYVLIDPKSFSESVSVVSFSASTDSSRPILTGIYLKLENNALNIVAVDGFRLSEKLTPVLNESNTEFNVVIPSKNLFEISKIFSNSKEKIKMALNSEDNLLLFESDGIFVASGILDGDFPDYKKIIPTEKIITAQIDTAELVSAIKICNVFSKDSTNIVKLNFSSDNTLSVSSYSDETGESITTFSCHIEGEPYEVAYNAKYLMDFLSNVKSSKVIYESKGALTPGVFKPLDIKDYLHIVMPSRI